MSIIFTPNPKYWFHGRDGSQSDHLVIKETWVENVYHITRDDLSDTGIIVDLGANIGSVSVYAASFNSDGHGPSVWVYAVEPEPDNLAYLEANILENKVAEYVTICPVAIGDSDGDVYISDQHGDSSISLYEESGTKVECQTLARFLSENSITYADVLKVDVEGAEYAIFREADDDILRKFNYITMEFSDANDEDFGSLIAKLAKNFQIHILGSPERGGYLFCRRYDV